jgi:hypothetical protein
VAGLLSPALPGGVVRFTRMCRTVFQGLHFLILSSKARVCSYRCGTKRVWMELLLPAQDAQSVKLNHNADLPWIFLKYE